MKPQIKNPCLQKITISLLLVFSLLTLGSSPAYTTETQKSLDMNHLSEFLRDFKEDPKTTMDKPFRKSGKSSIPVSFEAQKNRSFIEYKNVMREKICKTVKGEKVCAGDLKGRVAIESNDRAENLVDNPKTMLHNLSDMDDKGLFQAELKERPWSDDYWAIRNGVLGFRYADKNIGPYLNLDETTSEKKVSWSYFYDLHKTLYEGQIILSKETVTTLSPSEKFDLAFGLFGSKASLTKSMWQTGKPFFDSSGKVETWMGICHGWAPASFMYKRPVKPVTVKTPQGKDITFYPSDIRALGSLLWANAPSKTNFIGSRCNTKKPKKDEVSGRVIDKKCFDTNPGTWHKVVVNQIGVNQRSFVLDATYDYEVWNHPVVSYDFIYFNPTNKANREVMEKNEGEILGYKKWELARVDYEDFKDEDIFKNVRQTRNNSMNTKTKYIVGVFMSVEYVVETRPSHGKLEDASVTADYVYDLELDKNGRILGGEWYSNLHPDFLWMPVKNTKPDIGVAARSIKIENYMDTQTGVISPNKSIQRIVKKLNKNGIPLSTFVDYLFKESSK